ncbi:MAG: 3-deoxy-7-phosphoheptulonate synthase [Rhodothermales bacterium]
MVVVMQAGAEDVLVEAVIGRLSELGFDVHRSSGVHQTVLGAIGVKPDFDVRLVKVMSGVAEVYRVTAPYKFASRVWKKENTQIDVKGLSIGGENIVVMAGPNMLEDEEQLDKVASLLVEHGVSFLRADVHRPEVSPYSFKGVGESGLSILRNVADRHGLRVVCKVTGPEMVEKMADYVDVYHIRSTHMQNYDLLRAVGQSSKPVFLKRGLSSTIEEWLMSAEHILVEGNMQVILCEGGIRTFERYTRNTLDLSAIPIVKELSHLPIFADPSHGTGLRNKVMPMARAAIAAGADGLMIEVHPDPSRARSEGAQALFFDEFVELLDQVKQIGAAIGRTF